MAKTNQYFLALLCVKLTFCGPVSNLVDNYEKGVNHDCKNFPIPKHDSLTELCEFPVPDLKDAKKVSRKLKLEPIPLMCYSAMSNLMTLCPVDTSQELNFTKTVNTDINSLPVDKFCEEATNLSVKHCEKVPKDDKTDCELLTKVSTILSNKKLCEKHCIADDENDEKELDPVCQYLYFSTQAISNIYNDDKPDKVVLKSTEKSVNPDIPVPPTSNENNSSTTESQKKSEVKVTNEEKQDPEKGSTKVAGVETIDQKVEEEVKKEDEKTNKANPKPDGEISEQPGEVTTSTNAAENNAHADQQVQTDDNKKEPTLPEETPNQTKPEQGGGSVETIDTPIPQHHEGHPFTGQKESYNGISENTMQNGKSKSVDDSSSSFFSYFILLSIVAIVAYLVFHNKQKILALILEGRRSQGTRRRSGGKEYRKLDSNLEDTMNTESFTSGQHVIY